MSTIVFNAQHHWTKPSCVQQKRKSQFKWKNQKNKRQKVNPNFQVRISYMNQFQ